MSGFAGLPEAIDLAVALQPMRPEDTAYSDEDMSDEAALGLVLTDVASAITYLESKQLLPTVVDNSDDLIRAFSKPRLWADGKPRANLAMFVVLEAIEKLMPVFYMAIFGTGKRRPFWIEPVGKTSPEAARAKGSVLAWAIKQADLKEELRLMLKTILSYGFGIGWWSWETKRIRERVYSKQGTSMKRDWKEIELNLPKFENCDLKQIVYDPACKRQDVQNGARWVAKQVMITANDLDDMREDLDTYGRDEIGEDGSTKRVSRIPDRETLRNILAYKEEPTDDQFTANKRAVWREYQAQLDSESSSADPLSQPLEYIEYETESHVFGILQRRLVLRNQFNEDGEIHAVSCAFVDVLNSAWGFGIARLLAGEQRFQAGVANSWIDSLALILNPVYQALKGVGPGTQNIPISPGKVVTEAGELKPLVTPDVSGAAEGALANSENRAAKRIGANSGGDAPTQAFRTGTGMQALSTESAQRLQYFLEIFIGRVYLPVLEKFLYLCMEHLEPAAIQQILTEEEGKAWEGDISDVYNAKVSVDVIAGADLLAKTASAQITQVIIQLLSAAPVQDSFQIQGKKFDFENYIADMLELQGIEAENYIQDMTPADQQRAQQMNAAAAKGAADAQLQSQKHQDDLELANEKGTVQAGVAIVKKAAESHMSVAETALENMQQGEQSSGQ